MRSWSEHTYPGLHKHAEPDSVRILVVSQVKHWVSSGPVHVRQDQWQGVQVGSRPSE